jgi:hypothetical protein
MDGHRLTAQNTKLALGLQAASIRRVSTELTSRRPSGRLAFDERDHTSSTMALGSRGLVSPALFFLDCAPGAFVRARAARLRLYRSLRLRPRFAAFVLRP